MLANSRRDGRTLSGASAFRHCGRFSAVIASNRPSNGPFSLAASLDEIRSAGTSAGISKVGGDRRGSSVANPCPQGFSSWRGAPRMCFRQSRGHGSSSSGCKRDQRHVAHRCKQAWNHSCSSASVHGVPGALRSLLTRYWCCFHAISKYPIATSAITVVAANHYAVNSAIATMMLPAATAARPDTSTAKKSRSRRLTSGPLKLSPASVGRGAPPTTAATTTRAPSPISHTPACVLSKPLSPSRRVSDRRQTPMPERLDLRPLRRCGRRRTARPGRDPGSHLILRCRL
jgi:hypothetical protein